MAEAGDPIAGVLNREDLRRLVEGDPPLVADWLDLAAQLQPNGFDLSCQEVGQLVGKGVLGAANADRMLPDVEPIPFGTDGYLDLPPGPYRVTFNEAVALPTWLMALGRPRSSLNRSGVTLHTAVWDAGYRGRSTALLNVLNPAGFRLQRDARLLQLVFFALARPAVEGYQGQYLGENLG